MTSKILPLFAFFGAIAIFFGYVNPNWTGSIANARAAIVSDNAALTAANQYAARENVLATQRNAINPTDLAALEQMLPDSVDNVDMILDLDSLAASAGLSLTNINVANPGGSSEASAPAPGASPVDSVDLTLTADGTYPAFQTFLTGVESSQRLLDVRDVTIAGSNTGIYTYNLTIRLYWLDE